LFRRAVRGADETRTTGAANGGHERVAATRQRRLDQWMFDPKALQQRRSMGLDVNRLDMVKCAALSFEALRDHIGPQIQSL